jgi:hypothetical protein
MDTLAPNGTGALVEIVKLIVDGQGGLFAIGGYGEVKVFKFNSNGLLDSSFGNGTGVFTRDITGSNNNYVQDAVRDSLGRLYILSDGSYDNGVYLTRITASGEIDEGFGTKTLGLDSMNKPLGLALDSNGNVLVAYYKSYSTIHIARIQVDGTFDGTFGGGDGIADITLDSGYYSWTPSGAQLLSVDAQNRPVLAFQNSSNTKVIRLTSDGAVDFLYCVSKYPTPLSELRLSKVDFTKFSGFSDHSEGTTAACASFVLGSRILEKHLTLDKSAFGPDHACSMTPSELSYVHKFRVDWEQCR